MTNIQYPMTAAHICTDQLVGICPEDPVGMPMADRYAGACNLEFSSRRFKELRTLEGLKPLNPLDSRDSAACSLYEM
jgi:hypothetical protein